MSAAEQTEAPNPAIQQKTETRRSALLRRMDELMHEMENIRRELMDYSIGITDVELEPVLDSLSENKTRLIIDAPVEDMENVLAIYSPKDHRILQKDITVDSITEAAMMRLIERGLYTSSVDMVDYEGNLALRFRVGDEHHGKSIGGGMLLISSLPKTNNDAQWFATIENGQLTYNDQLKAFHAEGLQGKIEAMLELEEGPGLSDLEGYFLFIGSSELFSAFIKEPENEELTLVQNNDPAEMVSLKKSPSDDYLAKIGPNGRIRYRNSTAELVKQIRSKGRDAKLILNYINDLAIDRVDDPAFVYVILN